MSEEKNIENLTEDLPRVIAEMEKKCKQSPDNIVTLHHLGLVYMKAGKMDKAIECLEKCLEIDDQVAADLLALNQSEFSAARVP